VASSVEVLRTLRARPKLRGFVAGEIARYLGALSILIVGAVHAQQYYDAYFSVVPTIGTLFLLSFIGAGVVGAVLLAPIRGLAVAPGTEALEATTAAKGTAPRHPDETNRAEGDLGASGPIELLRACREYQPPSGVLG
jgi:hypothetical protein